MKKTHKLFLGLGAATTVIAPIATVVACGDSNNGNNNNIGDQQTPPVKAPDPIIIKQQTVIPVLDASQVPHYTLSSLNQEAKALNDKGMWNQGLAQHSLTQSLSFIRAFAMESGYDYQKDYIDVDKVKVDNKYIDRKTYAISSTQLAAAKQSGDFKSLVGDDEVLAHQVEVASNFHDANAHTEFDKQSHILSTGKDTVDGDQPQMYGLDFDENVIGQGADIEHNPLNVNTFRSKPNGILFDDVDSIHWGGYWALKEEQHNVAVSKSLNIATGEVNFANLAKGSSWADYKNPGTSIIHMESAHNLRDIYRANPKVDIEFKAVNALQTFPIWSDSDLNDNFLPYAKLLINRFMDLYHSGGATAASGISHIQTDFKNIIEFLIKKYTHDEVDAATGKTTTIFELQDKDIEAISKTLNNGSHHLLAIKAFARGFDKEFTGGNYSEISKESGIAGGWDAGKPLNGLAQMKAVTELTGYIYEANNDAPFIASMDRDEQYTEAAKRILNSFPNLMRGFTPAHNSGRDFMNEVRSEYFKRKGDESYAQFKTKYAAEITKYQIDTTKTLVDAKTQLLNHKDEIYYDEYKAKNSAIISANAIDVATLQKTDVAKQVEYFLFKQANQAAVTTAMTTLTISAADEKANIDKILAEVKKATTPAKVLQWQSVIDSHSTDNNWKTHKDMLGTFRVPANFVNYLKTTVKNTESQAILGVADRIIKSDSTSVTFEVFILNHNIRPLVSGYPDAVPTNQVIEKVQLTFLK